jgi:Flp pilus assembly protein TadD
MREKTFKNRKYVGKEHLYMGNSLLARSVESRLKNVSYNVRTAKLNLHKRDYHRARQFASKACIIDEYNIEAKYLEGYCHRKLEDFRGAMDVYRQIIDLFPGNAVAYLFLADCLLKVGKKEDAIENLLEAARLDTEGDIRELARDRILSLKESF